MNQRDYNKIYTNKNREGGSEKIFLGYRYDENEIILAKDTDTYFHIPLNATPVSLIDTDLIVNGAVAGTFPASSDRIFKSQKNYGNVTTNGTASYGNGTWFCSWLYKNPQTNISQWMDRFYQPGKFDYNTAVNQLFDAPEYVKTNPVFIDVVSTMVFEPGVLYRYFHIGERTASSLLETFEGKDGSRLKMHLVNWGSPQVDRSQNQLSVAVQTNSPAENLIYGAAIEDGVRKLNPTLDFESSYETAASVEYNKNYLTENEFTWTFWAYSKNWQESQSTQLIGNLSTKGGGVGIFIEALESFPFIALPETTYGHVIFINENRSQFLDKSVMVRGNPVNPICFGIDSNNHVIVCNEDSSGVIYKMDHTGHVLKTTKNVNDPSTLFNFTLEGERPQQLLCGRGDDFHIITNKAIHTFDANLVLKSSLGIPIADSNTKAAFRFNVELNTASLEIATNVLDVTFDEETKWTISSGDKNLYKDDVLFYNFSDASTVAIGPDKNLWITHGSNKITVLSPSLSSVLFSMEVGSPTIQEGKTRKKYLSFTKKFTKKANSREWSCVVYYSDEKTLYYYTLEGKLVKALDLNTTFDLSLIQKFSQKPELATFESIGDFTGYERQRVFNRIAPYNNSSQISIKVSALDTSKGKTIYTLPLKAYGSMSQWQKDSWKHFALVYKNKIASLYCDNSKIAELKLKGQYVINFDNQPSFFIGSPTGNTVGLNTELRYTSQIFNGKIGDIRIFDYALNPNDLPLFDFASTVSEDLIWPLPTSAMQYVEQIERVFKHKLPGAKSQFFKLKLMGTGITDPLTRQLVEEEIKNTIKETKPAYADLIKIEWNS